MSPQTLATLIEMAREARDSAAQLLAQDLRSSQELSQRISMLQQYRQEYSKRLEQAMQDGIELATLQDYQGFLASLDTTIRHAQDSLARQEEQAASSRQAWVEEQRRLTSYDALASRRQRQLEREQARIELRQNDEINTNKAARLWQDARDDDSQ